MAGNNIAQPSTNACVAGQQTKEDGPPRIEVILRRHPQEMAVERLAKEYIRTSQEATIEQLKMFLGKKLGYIPCSHFQVRCIDGDA